MEWETIIDCGGITGYWGSTEGSYLTSIFVLPHYQGKGVGRKIVEILEADEYFRRAWRTEVGSSLIAVSFYRKMGYELKMGITDADEYSVVRLENERKFEMKKRFFILDCVLAAQMALALKNYIMYKKDISIGTCGDGDYEV